MKVLHGVLPDRRITWEQFYATMHQKLEVIEPQIIIGLREGATVMSALLAAQLKPPHYYTVRASARQGSGSGNHGMNNLGLLATNLNTVKQLGNMTRVLLVDDVCDSGETMRQSREILEQFGSHVSTLAYVTFDHSNYFPDITFYTEPTNEYVYFPWEQ